MQISDYRTNYYNLQTNKNNLTRLYGQDNCQPSFRGIKPSKISDYFTRPTHKLKSYSIEEYKKLTALDKKILRLEYRLSGMFNKNFCKNTEIIHNQVSDYMKSTLDNKYGKDKYVVLTIGRSLSSIGKVLGYKIGENNVINIPMSSTHNYLRDNVLEELSEKAQKGIKCFLDSVGLTKKNIKDSGKTYVITDYSYSGYSLKGAERLLKSENFLGNQPNIVSQNINSMISESETNYLVVTALNEYLLDSKFKPFSFVNKNEHLQNTVNSVVDTRKKDKSVKLMWFKLLDNFMRGKNASIEQINRMKSKYITG